MKRGPKSAAELSVIVSEPPTGPTFSRTAPKPPAHLTAATAAWWRAVAAAYELEPHHLKLLQAAAEAWDRCQQARAALAEHGLTFADARGMVRARPEVAIERDSRTAFARLLRELDLDVEIPREERNRPPALRSNRR